MLRRSPLKRRSEVRVRTKETAQLIWPKHRRLLKAHVCVGWARDCKHCQGVITISHVRLGTNTGMSQTPPDWFAIPACVFHHLCVEHQHGEAQFERDHGIKLKKIALEFAAITAARDPEFRAAMDAHRQREPWLFEV